MRTRSLCGNGATPQSMLDYRREASYTPDFTPNLLNFVNLTGTQFLADTAAACRPMSTIAI